MKIMNALLIVVCLILIEEASSIKKPKYIARRPKFMKKLAPTFKNCQRYSDLKFAQKSCKKDSNNDRCKEIASKDRIFMKNAKWSFRIRCQVKKMSKKLKVIEQDISNSVFRKGMIQFVYNGSISFKKRDIYCLNENMYNVKQKTCPKFYEEQLNIWKIDYQKGNFEYNNDTGMLKILEEGYYWIYSQIVFYNKVHHNTYKIWRISMKSKKNRIEKIASCVESQGYNIFKSGKEEAEGATFVTVTEDKAKHNTKLRLGIRKHYVTCNTAIAEHLFVGDILILASPYSKREPSVDVYNSFWGVTQI
ncbi:DgyrCDS2136 [Dimorphilus gyrociliatus]|uniref:DgyrCDS2136 n=1 Tax=Dimorphilus gyrociliatus TaxID=2664684 RepID=A0A7I8V9K7_9ANNE|nr:DgyrCDS2136 [Dimorphilus gyrociliatus]